MSYGTDEGFQEWLDARGYTIPDGSASLAQLRQIGSEWLDATYGARFRGVPTDGVIQDGAWPRKNAKVYGGPIDDSIVPAAIVLAAYMASWQEALEPGILFGEVTTGTRQTKSEKVGPIAVNYFSGKEAQSNDGPYDPNISPSGSLAVPQIEQMLKPYMVLADYNLDIGSIGPGVRL